MKKVLLCDDEEGILRGLGRLLRSDGYSVVTTDGPEGYRAIGREGFDLILTDMRMPGVSGLEILNLAREHCPGTPILAMSGNGDLRDIVGAIEAGARDFLIKPFEFQKLKEIVERWLGPSPPNQGQLATLERAIGPWPESATVLADPLAVRSAARSDTGSGVAIFPEAAIGILRSVAHDLGGSLALMAALAQLIRDENKQTNEDIDRDARAIEKSTEYCHMLVKNLRHLYNASTPASPSLSAVDAVEAVRDVLQILETRIPKTVDQYITLPDHLNVAGYPTGVRQIVFNLLKNAIEAMSGQEHGRLEVQVLAEGSRARIVITDSGPGIPPESEGQIFRLNFTTKAGIGGSGTGLFVSRGIAREMNGDLTFQSRKRHGATFTLDLSLASYKDVAND